MSPETARQIAQSDPVPILSARWGQVAADTRKAVAALDDKLRELDTLTEQLAERDLVVATDLGPVGNAARAARTASLSDAQARPFTLPTTERAA